MDAEKNKKLQQYAVVLNEQATEAERNGKAEEASKQYLKLVDVFLVLAAEAQDHNAWQQYIRQAEAYQSRIRALNSKDPGAGSAPTATALKREIPGPAQQTDTTANKPSPLKKMFKPFQRGDETPPEIQHKQPPQSRQIVQAQEPANLPTRSTQNQVENSVPAEVYQRVLSENKILREKVASYTKESEERISTLEREKADLETRISEMVSREDYDAMQSEFAKMVPATEYDRLRGELLNSVPKEHYDDLLNRISDMVSKNVYLDAERRVMELQDELKNSVPKKVVEELASEVSLLGLLSEIPMQKVEPKEEVVENEARQLA